MEELGIKGSCVHNDGRGANLKESISMDIPGFRFISPKNENLIFSKSIWLCLLRPCRGERERERDRERVMERQRERERDTKKGHKLDWGLSGNLNR